MSRGRTRVKKFTRSQPVEVQLTTRGTWIACEYLCVIKFHGRTNHHRVQKVDDEHGSGWSTTVPANRIRARAA